MLGGTLWAAYLTAAGSVVALVLGPAGTRIGWWRFPLGFAVLALSVVLAAAAVVLGVTGGALARQWRLAALPIGVGVVVIATLVMQVLAARGVAAIHDISTDLEQPPEFDAVLALRPDGSSPPAYDGPEAMAGQRRSYADIQPLALRVPASQAFTRALDAARALGWHVVASDPATGRIEATDTTYWFHFTDDIVIRVRAADGGSRVDIRSKSRVGRGDMGTNAKRIRKFIKALSD